MQKYTVQKNHCNDLIVCLGDKLEPGYWIVYRGNFADCNRISKGADLSW